MRAVFRPVVRLWLEVVLPLYAVAFLIALFRPQYLPPVLHESASESLWPLIVWSMVGAMGGILGLSALMVLFFLLYSPIYLLNKSLLLVGKAGWVDKRELQFYVSCFLLLCLLLFLVYWDVYAALVTFVMFAGCGPVLWRMLV